MIEAEVTATRDEAEGIRGVTLAPVADATLPPFTAGAHVDVHLPGGIVRQYSLCGDPDGGGDYEIAVLREPASRGGSAAVHGLKVGARLRLSTPRNLFSLNEEARHTLLFAGGIGVTPVLSMAWRLHRLGANFVLHYSARSEARAAFVARLRAAPFAARVHFHFDEGPVGQRLDAARLLANPQPDSHLYVCGPGGFMTHVLDTGRAAGWRDECLHREYFAAPPADDGAAATAFEMEIASSGAVLPVPVGETALQVLLKAGFDIPISCEQGICGTCVIPVVSGTPDHQDSYLTSHERALNDRFTPCCSRAFSARLVLRL